MSQFTAFASEKEWEEEVHNNICKNDSLSVTKFLQFIGYGYGSRNDLFNPNKKTDENKYIQKAMKHGKKYETVCIEALKKIYPPPRWEVIAPKATVCKRGRLSGTVDAYILDREEGVNFIVEIKCPYGRNYGKFEPEEVPKNFEDLEKNWAHWLQLQLYLWLHEPLGLFQYGLLVYFYNGAGDNGNHVVTITTVEKHDNIDKRIRMEKYLDLFFNDYCKRTYYKPERVIKEKYIGLDIILIGLMRRRHIQISAKSTKEIQ